ncbi:MAG: hypothetical protein EAZ89_20250, partial [Bacteroidetes bacterium]
ALLTAQSPALEALTSGKAEDYNQLASNLFHGLIDTIEREIEAESKIADHLFEKCEDFYSDELARLEDAHDYESELGLALLKETWGAWAPLIAAINAENILVQTDVLPLYNYLSDKKHMKSARGIVEREMKEGREAVDELSTREVSDKPGFFETAWSILGCDSVGECAIDVALIAMTAGSAKVVKTAAKGAKATRKVRKAKKVVKSVGNFGKAIHKVLDSAKTLAKFASLAKSAIVDTLKYYGFWVKETWKGISGIVSKISTDLIATHTTGDGDETPEIVARRIAKEEVATLVGSKIGLKKGDPMDVRVALVFLAQKKYRPAEALIRTFLMDSLTYRTTVNTAFESIQAATPLTKGNEILKRVFISTVGEVSQDLVSAIPFVDKSGLAKYLVEAARKSVQKIFG